MGGITSSSVDDGSSWASAAECPGVMGDPNIPPRPPWNPREPHAGVQVSLSPAGHVARHAGDVGSHQLCHWLTRMSLGHSPIPRLEEGTSPSRPSRIVPTGDTGEWHGAHGDTWPRSAMPPAHPSS